MGRQDRQGEILLPKSGSLTTTIAGLAIATGIAPRELLETPADIVNEMIRIVNERNA